MKSSAIAILTTTLTLFLAAVSASPAQQQSQAQTQSQTQAQSQQQPPAAPGKPGETQASPAQPALAEAPKVDPEEEKAYQDFSQLKPDDFDKEIELGEAFAAKYPNSKYEEMIYSRLTNAYFNKQQLEKMYAASDRALALNPNDVTVLVLVGWVIPHNINPNDLEADRRLAKAEGYEKHALELLPILPKPATITDEEFASAKAKETATAHSGLGLIYFREQKPDESLKELQTATAAEDQPDPVDYFIMGVDLDGLKRYTEAADAFQKCASSPNAGAMQDRCKQQADKAKAQAAAQPAPKQ